VGTLGLDLGLDKSKEEAQWLNSHGLIVRRPEETQIHIQAPCPLSCAALPHTDRKKATATCITPSCTNTTLGQNKSLHCSLSSLVTVYVWWATESPEKHNLDDLNCRYRLNPGPPMCRASVLTQSYIPPTQMMFVFSQFRCQKCKFHKLTGLFHKRLFTQAAIFFFLCLHVASCFPDERESSSVSSFYNSSSAVGPDLTHLLKFPVCNAISLRTRGSTWWFRENTNILSITPPDLKFCFHPVVEDYFGWLLLSSTNISSPWYFITSHHCDHTDVTWGWCASHNVMLHIQSS
jgi:hypothetical protein